MREPNEHLIPDLRDVAEAHLGKPLAANANASLWRCPVCSPETHSLLLVSADEHRCLGRFVCDGGVSEWINDHLTDDVVPVGEALWTP